MIAPRSVPRIAEKWRCFCNTGDSSHSKPTDRLNVWFSTGSTSSSNSAVSPHPTEKGTTMEKAASRSRHRFRRRVPLEEVPSYHEFLQRQTVRNLYRDFLRTVRPIVVESRRELQAQIRTEFNATKNEVDPWQKKRAVKEGQRRLKELKTTIGTSVTFTSSSSRFSHGSSDIREEGTGETAGETSRVGTGWPWERNET